MKATRVIAVGLAIVCALGGSYVVPSNASGTPGSYGSLSLAVFDEWLCGVSVGGRWGTNAIAVDDLPHDYFRYLCRLNANWVGISVSITVEDSMDSSVEICGPEEAISTFSDLELRNLIRTLKHLGFHVYVTLAFENMGDGELGKQAHRWQLGDPYVYREYDYISPSYWPWDPDHPDHEGFVSDFFSSYTAIAVDYANLCAQEGVELFSLGTETDRLFRTRSHPGYWSTEFRDELRAMVASVRDVYDGALTYDMLYYAYIFESKVESPMDLWGDLDLDVIGVSAYFKLLKRSYVLPPSVAQLEQAWEGVFTSNLEPVAVRYPNKPIVFLEFGYTNAPGSAADPALEGFSKKEFVDRNGNDLDDGEEEQANIHEAFFNTVASRPGVVAGIFSWGSMIASDKQWNSSFGLMRDMSLRNTLAEGVVGQWFGTLGEACSVPDIDALAANIPPGLLLARSHEQQLSAGDWAQLPAVIDFEAEDPPRFGYAPDGGGYYSTDSADERFEDRGWQISSIQVAALDIGLALSITFADGDSPSEDSFVQYVFRFGDLRIHILSGTETVLFYGGRGNGLIWTPSYEYYWKTDQEVRLLVPNDILEEMFLPVRSLLYRGIDFHIKHTGPGGHGFVQYNGSGRVTDLRE